jgi:iron complex transport system permease protein
MLFIAIATFVVLAPRLNLLSVGSDAAAMRGVDVVRTQRLSFLSASLATGAAVSIGGPIGFIGIIVPHLVRLVVGPDHRLVARTVIAPLELPVGIVTAVIGGPFFLWLLVKNA